MSNFLQLVKATTQMDRAIDEINKLRDILRIIAWPRVDSNEEQLTISDLGRMINEKFTLRDLITIDSLEDLGAPDIHPSQVDGVIKRRPKYIHEYIGPSDNEYITPEDWRRYEQGLRDRDRENNTDSYRRGQSTKAAKRKKCQNCGCAGIKKKPDKLGRVHGGLLVHHIKPISQGGSVEDGLITLCCACHILVHTVNGTLNWNEVNEELTEKLKPKAHYPQNGPTSL